MTPREKFQALLKKLFQFDNAELDFGIYRIMNHKRAVIERFIETDLIKGLDEELKRGAHAEEAELARQLAEAMAKIRENFGDDALDAEGNLLKGKDLQLGKDYLALRTRGGGAARSSPELEAEIFNHLYAFFSRYYDDGDFMSLRRYSRRDKYAIPYNGEEVHLHWANADQYYIKTGENFTDYSYKHGGWTVWFKLRNADVEQNNVKGAKRFFISRTADVALDAKAHTLTIPFEYRPLNAAEEISYGKGNGAEDNGKSRAKKKKGQEGILADAAAAIQERAKKTPDALAALLHEKRRDADGDPVTLLDHHLRAYTRSNTTDFFIHKDLKGFLERELDFYLKNEVLNLDELEAGGEARSESWFQTLRALKAIGRQIIAFVAQIENFQKRLFEKKKFITEAHYCVTLDRVPEELYPEIAKNKAQIAEWKQLFCINEIKGDLATQGFKEPMKSEFLKANPHLVIDTKFFSLDFSEKLLASKTILRGAATLDQATNGLLIKSDNFQALRFLQQRYHAAIGCVYIDPPYNSKTSEILYKNSYKHSSWASLMNDRLRVSKNLSASDGSHVVAIDENEKDVLAFVLRSVFPDHNHISVAVIHNKKGIQGDHFSYTHESAHFCIPETLKYTNEKPIPPSEWEWDNLRKWGSESERDTAKNCFYPILVKGNKIINFGDVCPDSFHSKEANHPKSNGVTTVYPVDSEGIERKWRYARDSVESIKEILKVHTTRKGEIQVLKAKNSRQFKTVWDDSIYIAGDYGTRLLTEMGLEPDENLFPKSIHTVKDSIFSVSNADDVTLDYFGGSGTTAHAVLELNRADGGDRQCIMVEMGDYFDSILKPRLLKAIYSKDWKDGRPISREGSSYVMKYFRLESYEDTLDNISFETVDSQAMLQLDDYVLSYMLDFETKSSDTLLNVAKLDAPFDYKLRRHGKDEPLAVDLPETFNYLIGLHIATRRVYDNKGVRYLVYRGKSEGRETAIIWRTTRGWKKENFEADREFVAKHKLAEGAEDVFVNSDSFVEGARSLDPVFKRRMFSDE